MKIRETAPPSYNPGHDLATDRFMTFNAGTGASRTLFLTEDREGRPTADLENESKQDKNTLVVALPFVTLCHLIVGFDKKAGDFTFSHVSIQSSAPYSQIKNENPMDFLVVDVGDQFVESRFRKAMLKNGCAISSLTRIGPEDLKHTYQEAVRITYSVPDAQVVISSHKNGPSFLIQTPFKLEADLAKTDGAAIQEASQSEIEIKAAP